VFTISHDLRYALGTFRRSPGFAVTAIGSLGLAIGAATAVFGFLDALLFRPLNVPRPDDLVTFEQIDAAGARYRNLSLLDRDRLAELLAADPAGAAFTGLAAVTWADGFDPAASEAGARVSLVSGNYFSVLELVPRAGRAIVAADDEGDGAAVAVISDRYWQRRFRRSPSALGTPIALNGHAYTIVGIAPAGFDGDWIGWPTDVWLPSTSAPSILGQAGGSALRLRLQYKVIARLRPGIGIAPAQTIVENAYRQAQADPPAASGLVAKARLELASAATGYSPQRETFVQPLAILMAVVIVVLLIACANTANLLLARAAFRRREIGVRLALGATRSRIVRLLMTESALIALGGALLGILVARWGSDALAAIVRSAPIVAVMSAIPTAELDVTPDARVFAFAAAMSAIATILIGTTPAFRAARTPPGSALKTAPGTGAARGGGPRRTLLVAQIAASLALLVATGLLARTLHNLRTQDLGFDRDRVLLLWTRPAQSSPQSGTAAVLWQSVQERLSAMPGVTSASASVEGLLTGAPSGGPRLQPQASPDTIVRVPATMTVAPRFFATTGQPLLAGRDFTWDDSVDAPPVAIVNATLARQLFGSAPASGQQARFAGSELPPLRIVGVVGDARNASPRSSAAVLYYPAAQNVRRLARGMCLVVRTDMPAGALVGRLRTALREVDAALPVVRIDSVREQVDSVLFEERLLTGLSIFLAALAVLLTVVGLFGTVTFTTARRTGELGVRMALGATSGDVTWMVLRESGSVLVAGVLIGLPLTLFSSRWLASRLFGVTPADPLTIAAAVALISAAAGLAVMIPARRAARIDPLTALRAD
jgi:predicted permease